MHPKGTGLTNANKFASFTSVRDNLVTPFYYMSILTDLNIKIKYFSRRLGNRGLCEFKLCNANTVVSQDRAVIWGGNPEILFGLDGNVIFRIGGGHWTRASHVLLCWRVNPEALHGLSMRYEWEIDWNRIGYISWEVIACFLIGGDLQIIDDIKRFQLADNRFERIPTGFFKVTDEIELGVALRTNGD